MDCYRRGLLFEIKRAFSRNSQKWGNNTEQWSFAPEQMYFQMQSINCMQCGEYILSTAYHSQNIHCNCAYKNMHNQETEDDDTDYESIDDDLSESDINCNSYLEYDIESGCYVTEIKSENKLSSVEYVYYPFYCE